MHTQFRRILCLWVVSLRIITSIIVEIAEVFPCCNQEVQGLKKDGMTCSHDQQDCFSSMFTSPLDISKWQVSCGERHNSETFRKPPCGQRWGQMFQGGWQALFKWGTSHFIDTLSWFKRLKRWMGFLNITCMNEDCVSGRSSSHSTDRQQQQKKENLLCLDSV